MDILERRDVGKSGMTDWRQLWYNGLNEYQRIDQTTSDNNTMLNVTAQLGTTAFLHCPDKNVGDRGVRIILVN